MTASSGPLPPCLALLSLVVAACAGGGRSGPSPKADPTAAGRAAAAPAADAAPPAAPPAGPAKDYPATVREAIVDTLHGVEVSDPYRWLERADEPRVQAWMKAQDEYARARLGGLPGREALARRFTELYYIDSISPPVVRGGRLFYKRRKASQEKSVLCWRQGEKGTEQVLIDPAALAPDGTIALGGWSPSWDGRHVAYSLKPNNADNATLHIRDLSTGKDLPDRIDGARYAYASWTRDGKGFYYTWIPTDPAIPVDQVPGLQEVRYHALGTDPAEDPIVHPALKDPTTFLSADVSEDGRWLLLYVAHGWRSTDVYFRDLGDPKATGFQPLVVGVDALYGVTAWKGAFYVHTNEGAPRYRVLRADPRRPARAAWREVVPEGTDTLETVQVLGGHLVLVSLHNAVHRVDVRTLAGKPVREEILPGFGSVSGLSGTAGDDVAYYGFTSYTDPLQIHRTSIRTGRGSLWARIEVPADTTPFGLTQVFYRSHDGTRVSMFILHRKDLELDGSAPTLLTGYGGFNLTETPAFAGSFVVWLERGGLVAIPNLRGGGEYGEEWHRGGMLEKKQNVFDDFIAAAEHLIGEGYTRPERLAISGGSNGGLLVGAAMTQRPELFRAVVCAVPLLDMVRYHLFGAGRTWISEYGSADDPALFRALHAYSPYHRVRAGAAYPALLVLSSAADDRVDPMHARKFAAAVQWATGADRPVWLRIERNAGHGGADLVKRTVEEKVDTYAFLMAQLGMNAE